MAENPTTESLFLSLGVCHHTHCLQSNFFSHLFVPRLLRDVFLVMHSFADKAANYPSPGVVCAWCVGAEKEMMQDGPSIQGDGSCPEPGSQPTHPWHSSAFPFPARPQCQAGPGHLRATLFPKGKKK